MKIAVPCHSEHANFPPFRNGRDMMLLGDHRSWATGWPLWFRTELSGPDSLIYTPYTNNWTNNNSYNLYENGVSLSQSACKFPAISELARHDVGSGTTGFRATGWPLWLYTWTHSCPDNLIYTLYTCTHIFETYLKYLGNLGHTHVAFSHGDSFSVTEENKRGYLALPEERQKASNDVTETLLWQADSSSGSLIQYCQYFT